MSLTPPLLGLIGGFAWRGGYTPREADGWIPSQFDTLPGGAVRGTTFAGIRGAGLV